MEVIGILLIVGVVGLFFWTFRMSEKTAGVLHKGFIALVVLMGVVGLLATCMQSGGGDESIYERDYRR